MQTDSAATNSVISRWKKAFCLVEATSPNLMAVLITCPFRVVGNVQSLKDSLHCAFVCWLHGQRQKTGGIKRCQCKAALRNIVPKLRSSFLHSEKVRLCNFIVTNYSGMEDSAPQLRLTGNFQEGLKMWITSSTLCLGLNSQIQAWIPNLYTYRYAFVFLCSLLTQNSCFSLRKGGELCVKARGWRVGAWPPLASRRKLPKCRPKYTCWSLLILLSCHPTSTQCPSMAEEYGWVPISDGGGGHGGPEVCVLAGDL